MTVQIRAKQFATTKSQDYIQSEIIKHNENNLDASGDESSRTLSSFMSDNIKVVREFQESDHATAKLGYPTKFSKTLVQLEMASVYAEEKGDSIIYDLAKGSFYNGLTNKIP